MRREHSYDRRSTSPPRTAGVGYASVRLRGHVEPAALRVRVELGGHSLTLRPWLPPG